MKYARERAGAIFRRKKEKLSEAYSATDKLSNDERVAALVAGRFTVNNNSYRWYDRIVFEKPAEAMTYEEYTTRLATLTARYDAIIDELVLGDNAAALDLLRAFDSE